MNDVYFTCYTGSHVYCGHVCIFSSVLSSVVGLGVGVKLYTLCLNSQKYSYDAWQFMSGARRSKSWLDELISVLLSLYKKGKHAAEDKGK